LFSETADEETIERLDAFCQMQSGFAIAEKDLSLRGAGDLAGARQHGLTKLRIGDLGKDLELMEGARSEAAQIIKKDPELCAARNRFFKEMLEKRFDLSDEKEYAVSG
jgi:ATP-dependent DNA helicase RecG